MKIIFTLLLLVVSFTFVYSQNKTINGFVQDAKTGEKLPYSSVYIKKIGKGVITNTYGYFSIKVPTEAISLQVSYVGYSSQTIGLDLKSDTTITISLETSNQLNEVIIKDDSQKSQFNTSTISIQDLDKIPVLMGESDILKTMQLLPGIKGGQEGTSGLHVRGGSPDQNLILLDGVPVYNVNHLFGFMSVFNSESLKSVNVIKGGFPARYGGRLSSIVDIQMKEGNNQKCKGDISIGLLASKFTIEAPIIKDKTSFIVSGRRTYFDGLLALANAGTAMDGEERSSGYYFYDFNAKINHKINDKNQLFLSLYTGKDKAFFDYKYDDKNTVSKSNFDLHWQNTTLALRYNSILSPDLFMNTTAIFSKYIFSINNYNKTETGYDGKIYDWNEDKFSSNSGIKDYGFKCDFDYYALNAHAIKFGFNYTRHTFTPEVSNKSASSKNNQTSKIDTTFGSSKLLADEAAIFVEDNWELTPKLKANIGLRLATFYVQKKNYPAIEPRLSLNYLISNNLSINLAYTKMNQFIHMLSNSSSGLPTDLWLPSTNKVKPMNSEQYALSLQYNFPWFEAVVETYYKKMNQLIEYKEGNEYIENMGSWEDQVESGKGVAYGVEFLLRKTLGKTTGWLSYTLSKSERTFNNINFGNSFPYKYDRRHDISLVLTHKFSERFDLGLTWVFSSGNPITIATQKYVDVDNSSDNIIYYSPRNAYRMPNYHRLDIGANFYKQKKRGLRIWNISVYNAYNHFNPFIIYVKNNSGVKETRGYCLFPILPSISYTFRF